MNHVNNRHRQTGMTIIEILVALFIGLFLIGGLLQLFVNSKQSYRMQDNISRLQENGSFAMEFIARDLRMVGYRDIGGGCAPISGALAGADDNSDQNDSIVDGTDTVTVQMSLPGSCASALIYSIRPGANGQPALFKRIGTATAQELVEGIENMQILYGEDTNGDNTPDYYVAAGSVGDWERVISVRATLTARTLDANLDPTANDDGRLRRTYQSTITLRNRLP
jgi:type IV pilus assembly protein PilW